jgi:hypothetical protein
METTTVKLSQIRINESNPRTITKTKFDKLMDSILVFPKMLRIRPIVIDDTFTALGGNMRLEALKAIVKMDSKAISKRLSNVIGFADKPNEEQSFIVSFWNKFINEPNVEVIKASSLSEAERREFIIKDNASFGDWDFEKLANEFDTDELDAWGVDVPINDDGDMDGTSSGDGKKDLSDDIEQEYVIEVHCKDEAQQEALFNEMQERGFECNILTL